MNEHEWIQEFPAAITVCDEDGVLLEMNAKAAKTFEKDGGRKLIGSNMLVCHPEPARTKIERLLAARTRNVYTIEKNGIKKMIYQSPWYHNGEYAGFVEISLELPDTELPHFIRA